MGRKKSAKADSCQSSRLHKALMPSKVAKTFAKYVNPQVEKGPDACWLWTGHKDGKGYGTIHIGHGAEVCRTQWAHRVSFALHVEEIPQGMTVHHRCLNPSCVNPRHLSLATVEENTQEANARRTSFQAASDEPWTDPRRPTTDSPTIDCRHCAGCACVTGIIAECLNCGKVTRADGKEEVRRASKPKVKAS